MERGLRGECAPFCTPVLLKRGSLEGGTGFEEFAEEGALVALVLFEFAASAGGFLFGVFEVLAVGAHGVQESGAACDEFAGGSEGGGFEADGANECAKEAGEVSIGYDFFACVEFVRVACDEFVGVGDVALGDAANAGGGVGGKDSALTKDELSGGREGVADDGDEGEEAHATESGYGVGQ